MTEPITEPAKTNTDAGPVEEPKVDPAVEPPVEEPKVDPPAEPKAVAPEKYELALPKDSLLEPSRLDEIATLAKERGLSNEAAQEMLDQESGAIAKYEEGQHKTVADAREVWIEEAKADKEIGGENYKESYELSNRVMEKFGSDALNEILEVTHFGDHPEFIRLMRNVGKAMGEDSLVIGNSEGSGSTKTDAEALFGAGTEKQ